ncbi:hypothetical protein AUEXF2481DRAFT_275216 [Aureobasidium subglaciale EXF-2481]|uniref:DUF7587 domain-containing protein n=1 Tax=Aureobasidium subglaciale (strain EXF-2481) TaxID=1043005 RepID=A0A074YEB0_AURSE|nr:uncharacterized protein AUEXF2481DRAFT_275216 [Aureobasidium subglaciale EXF-2481]KEQ94409.1 hypothetical protein AUEXF2481DRAFT_275216 [Aureobasidium subglaciale EXF-2481]
MALPPSPDLSDTGLDSSGSLESSGFQALEGSRSTVPRYLFRCYSPSSGSICSVKRIRPRTPPTAFGPHTRDIVECHLRWGRQIESKFVSWTNSILVALVYAIRKLESDHYKDAKKEGICIAVLDVSTVPKTTPIYPANALMEAFDLPYDTPYKQYNHSWEFLVHGKVKNTPSNQRFSVLAIEEFIADGLFSIFKPFQDPESRLYARMNHVREELRLQSVVLDADIHAIAYMATSYHIEFALPVASALTAMLPVDTRLPANIKVLSECHFKGLRVPYSYLTQPQHSLNGPEDNEVSRFHRLMLSVCDLRIDEERALQGR